MTKVNAVKVAAPMLSTRSVLDRSEATFCSVSIQDRTPREVSRGAAVGGQHARSSHLAHNREITGRRARLLYLPHRRFPTAARAQRPAAPRAMRDDSQSQAPRRGIGRVVRLPVPFAVAWRRALPTAVSRGAPEAVRVRQDRIRACAASHCEDSQRRAQRPRPGIDSLAACSHPCSGSPVRRRGGTP